MEASSVGNWNVLPLQTHSLLALATAIPSITSDFHRLDDVSWYGSAYLLTEMSFQPTFGRLYSLYDAKAMYLVSIIACKQPKQAQQSCLTFCISRRRVDLMRLLAQFSSTDCWKGNFWGGSCRATLWKPGNIWEVRSFAGQAVWNGSCHEHVRHCGSAGTNSRRTYHRYASAHLAVLLLVCIHWVLPVTLIF